MRRLIAPGIALAVWSASAGGPARGQVVERERDVTITGPGGRSVERHLRSERGPGSVDRELEIRRPGGSLRREVRAYAPPGRPVPGGFVGGPRRYVGGPRVLVEREVVIDRRPYWGPGIGIAAPFFSFAFGPPPPPPVVLAPAPVYVAPPPPPVVVHEPPPPPPAVIPTDPMADALGRLRSGHDNSRRDGALTLGRLGDPRAVPALMDRLGRDGEKDVRVAAAWALAEIGDPRAGVALERAALFDKKREVREAAAEAYRRLPREVRVEAGPPVSAPATTPLEAAPPADPVSPEPGPPPPPEPAPTPFGDDPPLTAPGGDAGFPDPR